MYSGTFGVHARKSLSLAQDIFENCNGTRLHPMRAEYVFTFFMVKLMHYLVCKFAIHLMVVLLWKQRLYRICMHYAWILNKKTLKWAELGYFLWE